MEAFHLFAVFRFSRGFFLLLIIIFIPLVTGTPREGFQEASLACVYVRVCLSVCAYPHFRQYWTSLRLVHMDLCEEWYGRTSLPMLFIRLLISMKSGLTYRSDTSLFHLPITRICSLVQPAFDAAVAAPLRRL